MSKLDTLKALSGLQLAYSKDLGEQQIKFYVQMLVDIRPEILHKAVIRLIQASRFLPSIAEIRETAWSISRIENGTQDRGIAEAWAEVQDRVHDCHVYKKPYFSTPAIAEAVNAIGWMSLCLMRTSEVGTYRAQFRDFYKEAVARSRDTELNAIAGVKPAVRLPSGLEPVGAIVGGKENESC